VENGVCWTDGLFKDSWEIVIEWCS